MPKKAELEKRPDWIEGKYNFLKKDGKLYKLDPIKGGTVCHKHGGRNKKVKARAAIRAEVMNWGLGDSHVDPGEVLLRLVSQSVARAEMYAEELKALVDESPTLREALVAEVWVPTESGEAYQAGEYIRGLAKLEAEERDRCAGFAAKAVAAGIAERQVRVAEAQAVILAGVVKAVLDRLELVKSSKLSLRLS